MPRANVGEFERSSAQIWEGPRGWSGGRGRKDIILTEISHLTVSSRTQPAKGVRQTGAKKDQTHENFLVRGKQV